MLRQKIFKIASFLVLISMFSFVSPGAFAADEDETASIVESITSMDIDFSGDDKELVHYWIYEMFGDFVFAPWDSSYEDSSDITLLAKAVGYTSVLAMMLGVIIVYYVMIGGALNTAHSGQALGQQWSSLWIPIRTATGFFMIMPIASVGGGVFSFAQMFILWVIILGSNSATVLWDQSIDNLLSPSTKSASMQIGIQPSYDVFKMLACSDRNISYQKDIKSGIFMSDSDYLIAKVYTQTNDDSKKLSETITASSGTDANESFVASASTIATEIAKDDVVKIEFGLNGSCGTIEFPTQNTTIGDDRTLDIGYKKEIINESIQSTKSSISTLIKSHLEIISSLSNDMNVVTSIVEDKVKNKNASDYITMYETAFDKFYSATKTFNESIESNINTNITENSTLTEQWKEEVKKGGWGKAGVWFFEINSISMMSQKAISTLIDGITPGTNQICLVASTTYGNRDICANASKDFQTMISFASFLMIDSIDKAEEDDVSIMSGNSKIVAKCNAGLECKPDDGELKSTTNEMTKKIIDLLADGSPASSTDTSGGRNELTSPFQTVSSIGVSLNEYSAVLWGLAAATNGAIESVQSGSASSPSSWFGGGFVGGFIYGVGKFLIASIVMVAMSLAGSGFVLAYLIPFLPIVTWVMMMTGYLITVVEAVIAAPLAIILMATPEGEGIAGTRLERAMQLLAMAVLKPSLMIIGIIGAVTISGISFGIFNEFFFEAAEHVLTGNIFDTPALVILYTTTAFQLCKMLVGIMHKLPEQILDWFSSGVSRSFGESDISQMVEGGQSEAKGFMTNAGSGLSGSIKSSLDNKKSESEREIKRNKNLPSE